MNAFEQEQASFRQAMRGLGVIGLRSTRVEDEVGPAYHAQCERSAFFHLAERSAKDSVPRLCPHQPESHLARPMEHPLRF